MEKTEFKVSALNLIDEYFQREFDNEPMTDEQKEAYLSGADTLGIACTDIGDFGEIAVQVYYDLDNMAYVTELSGSDRHGNDVEVRYTEPHETMEGALADLEYIDFDSLVYPHNFDYDFMLREEEGE